MNKVLQVFEQISDEELRRAIAEIKISENSGIIETNSVVRKYANTISGITGNPPSNELFMTQMSLLRQAAFRWVGDSKPSSINTNSPSLDSKEKPQFGICVDAGTNGNPGPCFYRGVDIETREVLFHEELGIGTNNIAEFLAICHAVMYCEKNSHLNGITTSNIWSDSETAIAWFKHKKHKSTFEGELTQRLDKAIEFIKDKDIKINKWLTKEWGEIPADFGRK
jgi:ribonuclease HI